MRAMARLVLLLAMAGWRSETEGSTELGSPGENSPPGLSIANSPGQTPRDGRVAATDPAGGASDPLGPEVRTAITELIEGIRAADFRDTDELIGRIKARQAVHAAVLRLNKELGDPEPRIRRTGRLGPRRLRLRRRRQRPQSERLVEGSR